MLVFAIVFEALIVFLVGFVMATSYPKMKFATDPSAKSAYGVEFFSALWVMIYFLILLIFTALKL